MGKLTGFIRVGGAVRANRRLPGIPSRPADRLIIERSAGCAIGIIDQIGPIRGVG